MDFFGFFSPFARAENSSPVSETVLGIFSPLPLRKSLSQWVIKKSSRIMNLEENSCRNHESLR